MKLVPNMSLHTNPGIASMRAVALLFVAVLVPSFGASAGEELKGRSFVNENVGKVTLTAPADWEPVERHHIYFGTTFYRLLPPKPGQFDLEILVNDLKHMKMDALTDKDLEIYIESNMAAASPQSVEGNVKAVRFGAQRDGTYARLTDKAPKPGEFVLFTQGVRLSGNRVVLFKLYSNDRDASILKQALGIVESVKFDQ
jgi:hypothetical protein